MKATHTEQTRSLLAEILADEKISAKKLAADLGIAPTVVDRWLSGATHPPLYLLRAQCIPLLVRARIAAALLGPETPGPSGVRDGILESALLLRASGEATQRLADSLLEGAPHRARESVVALRDRAEKWLRVCSRFCAQVAA